MFTRIKLWWHGRKVQRDLDRYLSWSNLARPRYFDSDRSVRALARLDDARAVTILARAYSLQKEVTVQALSEMRRELVIDSLIHGLTAPRQTGRRFGVEPYHYTELRAKYAELLAIFADAQALAPLLPALEDERYDVRSSVVKLLEKVDSAHFVEPLIRALRDSYPQVGYACLPVVGQRGTDHIPC